MRLTYKIPALFILVGFLVLTVSFYASYEKSRQALMSQTFQYLTAHRESKKREIEDYFALVKHQIATHAASPLVIDSTRAMAKAFVQYPGDPVSTDKLGALREYYVNEFIPGIRDHVRSGIHVDKLVPASARTGKLQYAYVVEKGPGADAIYDRVHDMYHAEYEEYRKHNGYYDVFLIDPRGNVIYSVFKEVDFATNLRSGPYHHSGLADVFERAIKREKGISAPLADFSPYLPSHGKPAAFIASPVMDEDELLGVLAYQIPVERINKIMTSNSNWRNEGYGESGEAYLVARDFGMMNDSRFLIEQRNEYLRMLKEINVGDDIIENIRSYNTSVYFQKVNTEASVSALKGESDTRLILDYRGVEVLSSWAPLDIGGLNWAILSEIDAAEAFSGLKSIRQTFIVLGMVIFVIISILSLYLANRITRPVRTLVDLTRNISRADFSRRIDVRSRDEIGELARAFNSMSSSLEVNSKSREYVDNILQSMGEALFVLKSNSGDPDDLRIQTINNACLTLLDMEPAEVLYRQLHQFMARDRDFTDEELEALTRTSELPLSDRVLVNRHGRHIPVIFSVSRMEIQSATDTSLVLVCIAKDITERKQAEEKLRLSNAVFNNSFEPVMITDDRGNILDTNPAFEFSMGYRRDLLRKMSVSNIEAADDSIDLLEVLERTSLEENYRAQVSFLAHDEHARHFLLSCSAVPGEENEISNYVFVMTDVSDMKAQEERILNIANHDALTGLPNRMLFNDRLLHALATSKRTQTQLAVLYLDLDGFKAVNDTHGHQAGDELLIQVSGRMLEVLRESDTVARVGGDEFVIILENEAGEADYLRVADKLLQAINRPFELSMTRAQVSASIGIACYPSHADDQEALVKAADVAMYQAKNSGKNNVRLYQ